MTESVPDEIWDKTQVLYLRLGSRYEGTQAVLRLDLDREWQQLHEQCRLACGAVKSNHLHGLRLTVVDTGVELLERLKDGYLGHFDRADLGLARMAFESSVSELLAEFGKVRSHFKGLTAVA
jgi:hypothetical protein